MTSRSSLINTVLLLFALVSTWLILNWINTADVNTVNHTPDAFVTDVAATKMNIEGKVQNELYSPSMIHYPAGDTTDITTPHLIIHTKKGEPWHLYADKGQAKNGFKIIELWSNVRLEEPGGPENAPITMTTSAITIYPQTQTANTRQPVTIKQPGGIVQSIGLTADLNTGAIDLLSDVHGQYQKTPEK